MKINLNKMAVDALDHLDLIKRLDDLRKQSEDDAYAMNRFLLDVAVELETEKKKIITQMVKDTYVSILGQVWDDPYDSSLYSLMDQIKKIANHLNIETNASKSQK
jgi:hypothetical protein